MNDIKTELNYKFEDDVRCSFCNVMRKERAFFFSNHGKNAFICEKCIASVLYECGKYIKNSELNIGEK